MDPVSKGAWANRMRVTVRGNPDFFTVATQVYTKFDVLISLETADGDADFDVKESFLSVIFNDSADPSYFPDVLNDNNLGSDLLSVREPGADLSPFELAGVQTTAEPLAVGDGTLAQFTGTLGNPPIATNTLTISSTAAAAAQTVTDDGDGNLTGDIDATGNNTINYTTGAFDVTWTAAPDNATFIRATYFTAPTESNHDEDFTTGSDGVAAISRAEVTSPVLVTPSRGIFAFNAIDEIINIGLPDFVGNATIDGDLITYAEGRKDRFIVLSAAEGLSAQQILDYRRITLAANTSFAAIYYPWITILDPVKELTLNIPSIGHVLGVYARTDQTKSVGKAPAGKDDGKLLFSIGLERKVTDGEHELLNPAGVNALLQRAQLGRVVFGARTLELSGGEFPYIHFRRLFMFVEKSVFNATQGVVFENNTSDLRTRVTQQVTGFLLRLHGQGFFAGTTPDESFFVVCDETNNPQEVVSAGQLICDVGLAPAFPAEFVIFRFKQKTVSI